MKGFFKTIAFIIGGFVALLIIFNLFTFRVDEREQVIITQFDKIIRVIADDASDPSYVALRQDKNYKNIKIQEGKGMFFKLPFIQKTKAFSNQLLTYDTPPEEVFTLDKKTIVLDNFAQWEIVNPVLFMQNMGNPSSANKHFDENIY